MKHIIFFLMFLILVSFALAQDTPFDSKVEIVPPPLPGAERADLALEEAAELYFVNLSLQDINTKEKVSDVHVIVEINNDQGTKTIKYVDESGILTLNLGKGKYDIVLKADKLASEGSDYFYEQKLEVEENIQETVLLLPVGSVRGTVSYNGASVPSASVKFDCPGNYGDESEVVSDKYGSFSKDYLALGSCKIMATDNVKVGEAIVNVGAGKISEVEIVLDRDVRKGLTPGIIAIIVLIVVIIAVFTHILLLYRKKPKMKKKEEKEGHNKRLRDIMQTLNKREKEIVDMLFQHGEINQAKIIYQTGIPKTSIVRIFEHLESKKIIEMKKLGKAKHIKLTDWILEKEQKKA